MDPLHASVSHKIYASGIGVLWSDEADTRIMCNSIVIAAQSMATQLVIIWFSASQHRAADIVRELGDYTDCPHYCGCSSSGEVTPDGLQSKGFVAIALPSRWFSCDTLVMDSVASMGMETIALATASFRQTFLAARPDSMESGNFFALNLIDGLSYSEEPVTVAIDRGLEGIPLIGGSAGDDLEFHQTWQIAAGQYYKQASILTLVHCSLPCRVFSNNIVVPTEHKLVVTEADPDKRQVSEFNAEPAAVAYARATGLQLDELHAETFASYSLLVRFGGQYYCRSIQKLNEDGSLTFFCAIDNGLVMTVAKSTGCSTSSRKQIEQIEGDIGPVDMFLGFDCVYRKLDAQNRQSTRSVASLYREKNFIGFNTYGEQYGSMHINHTLTGIAIGVPPDKLSKNMKDG
ncbi:MAG: FIST N-terminal domain-containing protein [Granulosicoccus sp.]